MTVILVVVGALGSYYVGSTMSSGPAPGSHCSVPIGPRTHLDLPNNTEMTNVYQMIPGSTATVCVTYSFNKQGTFTPSTYPLQCGPYRAANRTIVWRCPGQITITPSVLSFDHSNHQNLTMAYTLRAPMNDSGVYWFWLDCTDALPVVVGELPPSLVFPIIPGCIYEPNAPGIASVVGVTNLGVAMVRVG